MSEFVINARKGAFAHTKVTVRSMATIGDVARKAGVSTTLVSRYLNGVKGVSPASKEKIESAIRELNYVPDESARMLVRRRGGGMPAEQPQKPQTAPAVAMVCEDVDFHDLSIDALLLQKLCRFQNIGYKLHHRMDHHHYTGQSKQTYLE